MINTSQIYHKNTTTNKCCGIYKKNQATFNPQKPLLQYRFEALLLHHESGQWSYIPYFQGFICKNYLSFQVQ
jgi:hypothetical protein